MNCSMQHSAVLHPSCWQLELHAWSLQPNIVMSGCWALTRSLRAVCRCPQYWEQLCQSRGARTSGQRVWQSGLPSLWSAAWVRLPVWPPAHTTAAVQLPHAHVSTFAEAALRACFSCTASASSVNRPQQKHALPWCSAKPRLPCSMRMVQQHLFACGRSHHKHAVRPLS